MISKIGNITLLTNLTTASGFAAFTLTKSETLQEFGLVAALSIVFIFIVSLILIPIWFSFFPAPKSKHTKHLDKKWVKYIVVILSEWVKNKRKVIYIVASILTVFGCLGLYMIKTTGNITDDLSRNSDVYQDFQFFEQNFGGVMPLEIIIDTKAKNGIMNRSFMSKVDKLQNELSNYKEFSKPISYIEFVKYSHQVYTGNPKAYRVPNDRTLKKIGELIDTNNLNNFDLILTDEINSKARISLRMNDLSTPDMDMIITMRSTCL